MSEGAVVEHAVCVIDREGGGAEVVGAEGITLRSLFTMSELEGAHMSRASARSQDGLRCAGSRLFSSR